VIIYCYLFPTQSAY